MLDFDKELARYIDHTILKPGTNWRQIQEVYRDALKYNFAAICIPPYYVNSTVEALKEAWLNVATVIGFPHGSNTFVTKFFEVTDAVNNGVDEIDFVINLGAIKSNNWQDVEMELGQVSQFLRVNGVILKVIIETSLLNKKEIEKVCEICVEQDVHFVKTSTGFNGEGATIENVQFLRKILPENVQIKASGGIRTRDFAWELIDAGAERLGCSRSVEIVQLP